MEYKAGAPDYEGMKIVNDFIKRWRDTEWTDENRDYATSSMCGIIDRLRNENNPCAEYAGFLMKGYIYARDKEREAGR